MDFDKSVSYYEKAQTWIIQRYQIPHDVVSQYLNFFRKRFPAVMLCIGKRNEYHHDVNIAMFTAIHSLLRVGAPQIYCTWYDYVEKDTITIK